MAWLFPLFRLPQPQAPTISGDIKFHKQIHLSDHLTGAGGVTSIFTVPPGLVFVVQSIEMSMNVTGVTAAPQQAHVEVRNQAGTFLDYLLTIVSSAKGLQWYDRNPISINGLYDATVGPHVEAVRITYTCPANRIAMVEVMGINATRITAAAPIGFVNVRWYCQPVGGVNRPFFTVTTFNNVTGVSIDRTIGSTMVLYAGDILTLTTTDVGTGGTIAYECGFKGSELEMHQMENEVIEFPNGVIVPSGHQVYVNRPAVANDLYYSISGWLGVPKTPMVDWFNT